MIKKNKNDMDKLYYIINIYFHNLWGPSIYIRIHIVENDKFLCHGGGRKMWFSEVL